MSSLRWFYVLLASVAVAAAALAFDRITDGDRHGVVQVIVSIALIVVFVSLFGFMSKLRD